MINNKINRYFLVLTLILSLLSCDTNNSVKVPETPNEFQTAIVQLLLNGNADLLGKAPLVDNDVAAQYHYKYADSLMNMVIQELDHFEFNKSLARLYNAGAHIFYGMAYKRTIYLHAQYPVMNFIEVRKNHMINFDSLFTNYLNEKNSITLIQLKNAWMQSMIEFMKADQSSIYDDMKKDFSIYITLYDSITNNYNKKNALKILTLESEKELFRQLTYLAVDVITTSRENGQVALAEFLSKGQKYEALIDDIPLNYETILSLSPTEYYKYFYHSEIAIYALIFEINKNI